MIHKYFVTLIATLYLGTNSIASETRTGSVASTSQLVNIVTTRTNSVLGNAIARHFSQILFIDDYSVRSGLIIKESIVSGNTSEITLETPLRIIKTYQFNNKNQRKWDKPHLVAQDFISVAAEEGLLAIN